MDLFVFSPVSSDVEDGVLDAIDRAELVGPIEAFTTVEMLANRLLRPKAPTTVAIVMAVDANTLRCLTAIRDLLWTVRVILIVPDSGSETVLMGHALHPSLMETPESDFSSVTAMLMKLNAASSIEASRPVVV